MRPNLACGRTAPQRDDGRASIRLRLGVALAACVALSHAACVGELGGDGAKSVGVPIVTSRFPRLSRSQWELTVRDLFGLHGPTGLSDSFTSDPLGGQTFDNNQSALKVTPSLWRDYEVAAESLAERVTSDPALLAVIAPPAQRNQPDRARVFVETLGARAFRRPLSPDEVNARLALFEQGAALYPALDPFIAGVRVSIAAFLQSPFFLYRAELTVEPNPRAPVPLSDWEIATRLSYALWNRMPDDELFRAAAAGELSNPDGIRKQVERMLDSPKATASVHGFFDQLYQGRQYESIDKAPTNQLFSSFPAGSGHEMRLELGKFTDEVYRSGGGLRELLTSTTTFIPPGIAKIYHVSPTAPPDGDGFARVELDSSQRVGILGLSGFLAWKGTDDEANTIQRGVFINRRITCTELGSPPPGARGAKLGDEPTNRERVNALTGPGTCGAGCHGKFINPAGYALEHFGAMGEYRASDGGHPIDSSATFPFENGPASYEGAVDFAEALAENPQTHACFSSFVVEYLAGRAPDSGDRAMIQDLSEQSRSGASARDLFAAVLESETFRNPHISEETP